MKYVKIYEDFNKIEDICKEYRIRNWTLNSDGTIDVDSIVDLSNKGLTQLPLKFGRVSGILYLENNFLKSLEGCPSFVGENFYFYNNRITSFKGCPSHVGGDLYCGDNPIYEVWKLFKDIDKIELFNEYDIIRGDSVIIDRLNDFLVTIGKDPVESVKGYDNI